MRILLIISIFIINFHKANSASSYTAYYTNESPNIDGIASEQCWTVAQWAAVDHLLAGNAGSSSNCTVRYKASWNESKLFVLMEVTDDVLSNWHPEEPLKNYPSSDCPEIFIDEDHSGGNHEMSYNAFAYHISTLYNIVDITTSNSPALFNKHVEVKRTNKGNIYTWEFAINVYTDEFIYEIPNNPLAKLYDGKVLGFTVAYNDSDLKQDVRERQLASTLVTPMDCENAGIRHSGSNCSYQTASVFGTLILAKQFPTFIEAAAKKTFKIILRENDLLIPSVDTSDWDSLHISSVDGKILVKTTLQNNIARWDKPLVPGNIYLITLSNETNAITRKIEL